MGSTLRTSSSLLVVATLSFLLATSNWLQVLFIFVALSLGWVFWSMFLEIKRARQMRLLQRQSQNAFLTATKGLAAGNVYQFPVGSWQNAGLADAGNSFE